MLKRTGTRTTLWPVKLPVTVSVAVSVWLPARTKVTPPGNTRRPLSVPTNA